MRRGTPAWPCFALLVWTTLAAAQVQTKDQQKCTLALNKALQKVAATLAKQADGCMKDGAKGKLDGTVETCLADDRGGKLAAATTKTGQQFDKLCTGTSKSDPSSPRLPPWGATDAAVVNGAGGGEANALLRDVFVHRFAGASK